MNYQPERACPLDGIRVLDLSRLVAGNMLTLQLADFGAEVIKLEPPEGDPLRHWCAGGIPVFWKVYCRNKKSVRIDLWSDEGKDKLTTLLPTAHVLVESFRPGVMEAAGFAPETVLELNPRLVMVRISGWGQTGAYRDRPGFGSLVEAMCGFASKNGFQHQPPLLPNMALADMVAGLSGAFAVMVALRAAERDGGKGQVIDLSLLEPLHSILGPDAAEHRATGSMTQREGNRSSVAAPRNIYKTSDAQWLALSASTQSMAERLFTAIGRADMITDPRFRTNADRLTNVAAVDAVIEEFVGRRTLSENLAFFETTRVTVGPVYDPSSFEKDRHVIDRGVLVELPDTELGRIPMHDVVPRLSQTPGAIRHRAPALGEHESEIFGQQIAKMDAKRPQ